MSFFAEAKPDSPGFHKIDHTPRGGDGNGAREELLGVLA